MAGLSKGERVEGERRIARRGEYAAFMGECERLGVNVGGNAEAKYAAFRRVLVVCACLREGVQPSVFARMSPLGVLMFLGLDGACKGEPGADALAAGACGDVALNGVAA